MISEANRHLLDIETEQLHEAERHGQGNRDRNRISKRRTPFQNPISETKITSAIASSNSG